MRMRPPAAAVDPDRRLRWRSRRGRCRRRSATSSTRRWRAFAAEPADTRPRVLPRLRRLRRRARVRRGNQARRAARGREIRLARCAPCCCSTTGATSSTYPLASASSLRYALERAGARHESRRGRAVSRAVIARLEGRDHRRVEHRHDAAGAQRRHARDAAGGVRHPLEGGRGLGLLLGRVRQAAGRQPHHRASPPPRRTAPRSAARTSATSPTSAKRSIATRCRGATDLRDAFDAARQEIRRREKEEDVRPSQPQAYFGPLMEEKLRGIEQANALLIRH